MSKKETVQAVVSAFRPIAERQQVDYLMVMQVDGDDYAAIAEMQYSDGFPHINIESITSDETFRNNSIKNFMDLTLDSEGHTIHCRIIPLLNNETAAGYCILQSNTTPDEKISEETAFLRDVLSALLPVTKGSGNDRYKDELIKMRTMQAKLFPRFDNVPGMDISSIFLPVELMSGSFIDAKFLDDKVYQLVACDVTGYDATSNFTSAAIRTLIHSFSSRKMVPSILIETIIDRLKKMLSDMHSLVFITIYHINTESGRVQASSYGPVSTIYYNATKKGHANLGNTEIGKALQKRAIYKDISFSLGQGDAILYFSQGAANATTEDGSKQFGEDRIIKTFRENIDSSATDVTQGLADAIYDFTNYSPIDEDILMLCIKKV